MIDRRPAHSQSRPAAVHRLNRAEYANAIRDLLAMDIDIGSLLPSDDTGYGFDNIGDVLSVSPLLLERYIAAARKISRMAIGDSFFRPVDEDFEIPEDLLQNERMSEDLPLRSRGGAAIRYSFPADGEYVVKIRLVRDIGDGAPVIRGVALKRQLDVRLDKERLRLFSVGGEHFGVTGDESSAGDSKQNEYETRGADAALELRVSVTAGPHLLGVAFPVTESPEPDSIVLRARGRREGKNAEPAVKSVTIRGPYNAKSLGQTPSRQKIFMCEPGNDRAGQEACARKILSALVHRAYRRPVTEEDLHALLGVYKTGLDHAGFEEGIRMALEGMLVSPDFLFRKERDPANATPGTPYRISDLELASRLSFFLWSTIPDDELLGLAERGRLKEKAVLEAQVQRMLRDARASKPS